MLMLFILLILFSYRNKNEERLESQLWKLVTDISGVREYDKPLNRYLFRHQINRFTNRQNASSQVTFLCGRLTNNKKG